MFDRQQVRLLRDRMQAALDPLGSELQLKFIVGSASYTADNVRFKVEAATIKEDGQVVDQATTDFELLAPHYGLKPTDLGREFSINGRRYTLTGLKPRCRRYPILARRDGKTWKLPVAAVVIALNS